MDALLSDIPAPPDEVSPLDMSRTSSVSRTTLLTETRVEKKTSTAKTANYEAANRSTRAESYVTANVSIKKEKKAKRIDESTESFNTQGNTTQTTKYREMPKNSPRTGSLTTQGWEERCISANSPSDKVSDRRRSTEGSFNIKERLELKTKEWHQRSSQSTADEAEIRPQNTNTKQTEFAVAINMQKHRPSTKTAKNTDKGNIKSPEQRIDNKNYDSSFMKNWEKRRAENVQRSERSKNQSTNSKDTSKQLDEKEMVPEPDERSEESFVSSAITVTGKDMHEEVTGCE